MSGKDGSTARKIKVISGKSGIRYRYSVLNDFSEKPEKFSFFPKNKALEPLPGLDARMEIYNREAPLLAMEAVKKIRNFSKIKDKITHIITVTCTGLYAPGLEIDLIKDLGLKTGIERSSVNFMGCNAALIALRQADHISRSSLNALVLVVCVELCSIHFQKEFSEDYILSNLVFADGAAAVLVSADKKLAPGSYKPLKIRSFQSVLIHEGQKDMAWKITEKGFIMSLSSYVSGKLNKNMTALLSENGIRKEDVRHWAIHPGGKRILDEFAATMDLNKEELACAYEVLKKYGNMSSSTILFVLQELLQTQKLQKQDTIFAAAFGPGLSIESCLMDYV